MRRKNKRLYSNKFDKKYFNTLKQQFSEKLGGGCSFYRPKLIYKIIKK